MPAADPTPVRGMVLLIALLLVVGGAWAFIEILDEVREGDTQKFDDWALLSLRDPVDSSRPRGPRWVEEFARDATALGGVLCLTLISLAVTIYLLLEGKRHSAILVAASTLGGAVLSSLLKYLVARDRPDLVPHLSQVYTSSFPSGHSMLSAAVYLTLGSLLLRVTEHRRVKIFFLLIAVFLTALVGFSRVYMGVHYPTDVLGGWCAGIVWAITCWLIATILQRRHVIEKPEEHVQE